MTQTTASDGNVQGNTRAHDWMHLAFGAILTVSPWLKNFSGGPTATKVAVATGATIAVLAIISVLRSFEWAAWGVVAAGACALATPFIMGLAPPSLAFKTFLLVGALSLGSGLWKIWKVRNPDKV